MTRDDIRLIVGETMNELEHKYGVDELADYGSPTCDEITTKLAGRFGDKLGIALTGTESEAIADALELLAGIDEGEHTDRAELLRLAVIVRPVRAETKR